MQTNVQIDSKNLRASPDPTSVQVYDPRTRTLKVSGCWVKHRECAKHGTRSFYLYGLFHNAIGILVYLVSESK